MAQALVRNLDDDVLAAYRASARLHGRSLEAELRALIEAHRPLVKKSRKELLRLSDEALAMTPPDGPPIGSDSTWDIRWDRDTQRGKWVDEGWSDDDAGR